ncbi:MAG: hypothetical protein NWE95_02085 [Candidatus Bathyarchaeota archaeon]|nr:hypothetical protein [Candidatus Bathyarchaeota archaeon]
MFFKEITLPKFTFIIIGFLLALIAFIIGGISALSLIARVLFVLFLPGYSILQALAWKDLRLTEKLILSPIIGIAYTTLTALYLSFLHVPINQYTIILSVLLLSVPLLAYSWRRGTLKTNLKPFTMPLSYLLLIALMIASVVLISFPWPENGILIPIGDDPATSTLAATLIAEQGTIPQSWAPYFPEQAQFTYPPAYPSVIAFLYLLDPSMSMPILVSFFSLSFVIIHAQVFIIARRVLNDDRIALCATAFTTLLSSGFYSMVTYGRFPALVGLALTLSTMLLLYLYSISGKLKLLLLAGATLASVFLAYTVSFITTALFIVLFSSFGLFFSQKKKQSILAGITVIVVGIGLALPWVINIFKRVMVPIPPMEYQALLAWFTTSSMRSEFGYNSFMYYGYWLLLFGILTFTAVFVRRKSRSFLLAWFLSIFLLMLNEIFRVPFPGWYYLQSSFLNPLLSLPILVIVAFCFVKAYDWVKNKLQVLAYKRWINLHSIIMIALLLSVLFIGVDTILPRNDIHINRISSADYNALMWISNHTPKDAVIYNDHWVGTSSTWIPVLSGRRIVMPLLSISEVGWSDMMFTRQDESRIVAKDPRSAEALAILKKYNASYIYLSNYASHQVQKWRDNYNVTLFLESAHYELVFNEEDAWVIKINY